MRDDHAPGPSLGAEAALFAVTATTVFSFVRLFDGTSYLGPLLAVALVVHVVCAVARRWHWPALPAGLVTVGAAFLTFVALRYRSEAFGVIPTPAVVARMRSDLAGAADAFRTVVTPTAPHPGFVLGLAGLVTLVGIGADGLAFRLRARAEAIVPAGGLFLFTAVLGGSRMRLISTGLFAAAVLVFVLLDRTSASRTSNQWVIGDRKRDSRTLLQAGALLALATCFVGIATATAAPHHDQSPWTRWRHGSNEKTRVTVSPLVDLHDRLVEQTNDLLFTVKADRPAYWRITSLDDFDNEVWSSNNSFDKADGKLAKPSPARRTAPLRQRFDLLALAQVWAPAAFEPARISGTGKLLYDSRSGTLIVQRGVATSDGLQYSVTSDVPDVRRTDLVQGGKPMSRRDHDHYTALPADLPAEVRTTAQTVIQQAGARTRYDKARALQDWFRTNFQYSLDPDLGADGGPAITAFLHIRKGWCEQFAGTYAVMARSLGLPTRLAVGFTPGRADPNSPGTFDVYGRQAHAWPEVWFPGEGWVAFEPTPGRGAPGAQDYTGVPFQQDDASSGPPAAAPPTVTQTSPNSSAAQPPPTTATPAPPVTKPPSPLDAHTGGSGLGVLAAVGLAIGGLAGLVLLTVGGLALLRWWLRHRRRRHARSPAEQVAVAWDEACDAVSLVAEPPDRAETRLEYAQRSGTALTNGETLSHLADLTTAVVWDEQPPPPDVVGEANGMAVRVDRAVRDDLGPVRHALARLDPRSLRKMAKRR